MSDVTHLSETFYDDFAVVTNHLRQVLTWGEYKKFHKFIMRKDIVAATALLEALHDEKTVSINLWSLSQIRKNADSWHDFYRTIQYLIDRWEPLNNAIIEWIDLIVRNGGSQTVTRLVKEKRKRLPAQKPVQVAVLR